MNGAVRLPKNGAVRLRPPPKLPWLYGAVWRNSFHNSAVRYRYLECVTQYGTVRSLHKQIPASRCGTRYRYSASRVRSRFLNRKARIRWQEYTKKDTVR